MNLTAINRDIRKKDVRVVYEVIYSANINGEAYLTQKQIRDRLKVGITQARFNDAIESLLASGWVDQGRKKERAVYSVAQEAIELGLKEYGGVLPSKLKGVKVYRSE